MHIKDGGDYMKDNISYWYSGCDMTCVTEWTPNDLGA